MNDLTKMGFFQRLMRMDMLLLVAIIGVALYFILRRPKSIGNMLGFNSHPSQQMRVQSAPAPAPSAKAVASISEEAAKQKMSGKAVIGFMADFCKHCTDMKPAFFQVAGSMPSVHWVDASGESKLVEELGIEGFPSILFFKNGQKVGEYKGSRSASSMKKAFETFLSD